jgi:hypothetical protein
MAIVFIVVIAVVIFVIAAVLIGRETTRLSAAPPRPVYDIDEAVVWIADQLPEDVSAQLSHADVRQIIHWSMNHLRVLALDDRTADEEETFGYVVDQAAEAGKVWTSTEVKAVLDGQAEYLTVIGAAGPVPFLAPERGGGPTEE